MRWTVCSREIEEHARGDGPQRLRCRGVGKPHVRKMQELEQHVQRVVI